MEEEYIQHIIRKYFWKILEVRKIIPNHFLLVPLSTNAQIDYDEVLGGNLNTITTGSFIKSSIS